MPTKSAFASKGVWGGAAATVAGIISFFHTVNLVGLAQAFADNWPAILAAGGGILSAIGRIRASTFIAPPAGTIAAANVAKTAIVIALLPAIFGLTSCDTLKKFESSLSPAQQAQIAQLESSVITIGSSFVNAAAAYGTAVAASKIKPGNPYLDSVALGLRNLEGKTLVTPAQVQAVVTSFGDPNNPDAFKTLGQQVGDIVTNYGLATVTDTALGATARALNDLNAAATKLQAKAAATAP